MNIIAGPAAPIEAFGQITPVDETDLFHDCGTLKAMPAAFSFDTMMCGHVWQ